MTGIRMRRACTIVVSAVLAASVAAAQESPEQRKARAVAQLQQMRTECTALSGPTLGYFPKLVQACVTGCEKALNELRMRPLQEVSVSPCLRNRADAGLYLSGQLFKEGQQFDRVTPPVSTGAPPGKTEILMLSSLACGQCLQARQKLTEWAAVRPGIVTRFVPVMWGFDQKRSLDYDAYAKVDIFCDLLGDSSLAMRIRKHTAALPYEKRLTRDADVRPMLEAAGVGPEDLRLLDGFFLQARVQQAREMAKRYPVEDAPTYLLDGKYRIKGGSSAFDQLDVADFLMNRDAGVVGRPR